MRGMRSTVTRGMRGIVGGGVLTLSLATAAGAAVPLGPATIADLRDKAAPAGVNPDTVPRQRPWPGRAPGRSRRRCP